MNTKNTKSLAEEVYEIRANKSMSVRQKAAAMVKLGVTPYEAMILAQIQVAPNDIFTYTFGVEIECVNCRYNDFFAAARRNGLSIFDQVYYNHHDMPVYKLTTDSSLVGDNTAECVTPPLNSTDGFESLEACCKSLNEIGANVNKSCGLHVHIGAADLTDREYCNVFVNYMALEDAIDSFMAPSRRNSHWCNSLKSHRSAILFASTREEMRAAFGGDRYYKVNACAYRAHKTIEFRQHSGSTDFEKISAWVKFLGKLVEYSKEHRFSRPVNRIEDIPFLTDEEKSYFIARRQKFASIAA